MRILPLLASLLLLLSSIASAHDPRFCRAHMVINDQGTTWTLTVHYDVDSMLAETDPYHMTDSDFQRLARVPREKWQAWLEELIPEFEQYVTVAFDGHKARPTRITFPDYARGLPRAPFGKQYYETHTRRIYFEGSIPAGANQLTLRFRQLGPASVTIEHRGGPPAMKTQLEMDQVSDPFPVRPVVQQRRNPGTPNS